MPKTVNERAKQILSHLENEQIENKQSLSAQPAKSGDLQLTLFGFEPHPLLDEIRETDLNELAPIELMKLVQDWQQQLDSVQTR